MMNTVIFQPGMTLEELEKHAILCSFRFHRGNKTATSNALGIAIRTLDAKLEKYEKDGEEGKKRMDEQRALAEDFSRRQRGLPSLLKTEEPEQTAAVVDMPVKQMRKAK